MKAEIASLLLCCASSIAIAQPEAPLPDGKLADPQRSGPTLVVDAASASIFPDSWRTPAIDAKAQPLDDSERARSLALLRSALAKYPPRVPGANLNAVCVVGRLEYSDVRTGGTNSRRNVYVVNRKGYSDRDVEKNFHAEFSSILLRNFPQFLDTAKWRQINPPEFSYRGTGVQAVRQKQASLVEAAALNQQGFLHEYAQADLEDDFNAIAARLFTGDAAFWQRLESTRA